MVCIMHLMTSIYIFIALQLKFGLNQVPIPQRSNMLGTGSSNDYVHKIIVSYAMTEIIYIYTYCTHM